MTFRIGNLHVDNSSYRTKGLRYRYDEMINRGERPGISNLGRPGC